MEMPGALEIPGVVAWERVPVDGGDGADILEAFFLATWSTKNTERLGEAWWVAVGW